MLMEWNLETGRLETWEAVCDSVWETPLEWDCLLPEGCADMARVLNAQAVPLGAQWQVQESRLSVQSTVQVQVLYLDEEGELCQAQFNMPVSKNIPLPEKVSEPVCRIELNVEYFQCRMVSPRRLDLRGSLSVAAGVWQQTPREIVLDACGCKAALRRKTIPCCKRMPTVCCDYDLNEELELAYGKPLVQSVLQVQVKIPVTEKKIVTGKAVIKGEVCMTVLYRPQTGDCSVETMDYVLPFTQVADLPMVDEDWVCSVHYHVVSVSVKPSGRQDAYGSRLSLNMVLSAVADGYVPMEQTIVTDGYSTCCETELQRERLSVLTPMRTVSEQFAVKGTLDCPALSEVLYLWTTMGEVRSRWQEEEFLVHVTIPTTILGKDENGGLVCYRQDWKIEEALHFPQTGETLQFRPWVELDGVSYTIGSGEAALRGTLTVEGVLFGVERPEVVCSMGVLEDKPKQTNGDAIYLYYADGSQSLWDIAKSHNASCDVILPENGFDSADETPSGLIIIPPGS